MFDLRAAADMSNATSLSAKLRRRRFAWFEALIANLPRPIRLIDIGGTETFWEKSGGLAGTMWISRRSIITRQNGGSKSRNRSNGHNPFIGGKGYA